MLGLRCCLSLGRILGSLGGRGFLLLRSTAKLEADKVLTDDDGVLFSDEELLDDAGLGGIDSNIDLDGCQSDLLQNMAL